MFVATKRCRVGMSSREYYPSLSGLDTRLLAATISAQGSEKRVRVDDGSFDGTNSIPSSLEVHWYRIKDDYVILGPRTSAGTNDLNAFDGYDVMTADLNRQSIDGTGKRRGDSFVPFETSEELEAKFSVASSMFLGRPRFQMQVPVPNSSKTGAIYLHTAEPLVNLVGSGPPDEAKDSIFALRHWMRTIDNFEFTDTTPNVSYETWDDVKSVEVKPVDALLELVQQARTIYSRFAGVTSPADRRRVVATLLKVMHTPDTPVGEDYFRQWLDPNPPVGFYRTATDAMAILFQMQHVRIERSTNWKARDKLRALLSMGEDEDWPSYLHDFFSGVWNPFWDLQLFFEGVNESFGDEADGSNVLTFRDVAREHFSNRVENQSRRYAFFLRLERWLNDTGTPLDQLLNTYRESIDEVNGSTAAYLPPLKQSDEMYAVCTLYTPKLEREAMGIVATKRNGDNWEESARALVKECPWHDISKMVL